MAKLSKQYKGTAASNINLPTLSVTQSRPVGQSTAANLYDGLTKSIGQMQTFLEDRAKSASVEAGFQYSLSNTPTTEEIESMVSDPSQPTVKEKLPFKHDSVNVAEQTARAYITEKIRFKAELQAEEKLQKLFTFDSFNEDLSISEMDSRALDIVNQYGQMFTGNRASKTSFDANMSVYLKGQRKSNLSVRNQVYLQEESADINKRIVMLDESNLEIYNSNDVENRIKAVLNRYNTLENHIETTTSYNRPEQLKKLYKAKDIAVQNLAKNAFVEYSQDPIGEPNKQKLQILINDVASFYKDRPFAGLSSIVNGSVLAAADDEDMSGWQTLKELNYEGKNIQLHPSWKIIEGEARDTIYKKQYEKIEIGKKAEAITVISVKDELVKNFGTLNYNTRTEQSQYITDTYPDISDAMKKEILDGAEKTIQGSVVPAMNDESMNSYIEGIQKQITDLNSSAEYVTKELLKNEYLNDKDEKYIETWAKNYDTNVKALPDYVDFSAPLAFRQKDIASNMLDIGTEDYKQRQNRLENLFKGQVLNKNIEDVMSFLTTKHNTSDDTYNNLYGFAASSLLRDLEETAEKRGVNLNNLDFNNLNSIEKRKVFQLFSYHSSYLHITGANDKQKFESKMKIDFKIFGIDVPDDYEAETILSFPNDKATDATGEDTI
tara:strand:- start:1322 stop:3310 length:1989 start_codon:yes stop_codon:yes gene_type:complete